MNVNRLLHQEAFPEVVLILLCCMEGAVSSSKRVDSAVPVILSGVK